MANNPPSFLTDHSDIQAYLAKYFVIFGDIVIEADGQVSVLGSVQGKEDKEDLDWAHLRVQFKKVTHFKLENVPLESLKGCPRQVVTFDIHALPNLCSLEGSPSEVTQSFSATNCVNLVSLKGCPSVIPGYFNIGYNDSLSSLAHGPTSVITYYCHDNKNLKSLISPLQDVDSFTCSSCTALTTLEGLPSTVKRITAGSCYHLHTIEHLQGDIDALHVEHCFALKSLKGPRSVREIAAKNAGVRTLADSPTVWGNFDLKDCHHLRTLEGLICTGTVLLSDFPECPISTVASILKHNTTIQCQRNNKVSKALKKYSETQDFLELLSTLHTMRAYKNQKIAPPETTEPTDALTL